MRLTCPACGSAKTYQSALASDYFYHTTVESFSFRRCDSCDTIFQSEPPPPEEIGRYYPQSYGPHHARGNDHRYLQKLIDKVHGKLCSYYPFFFQREDFFESMAAGDLLLDYGCGGGEALDRAKTKGAHTLGVDFVDSLLSDLERRGHSAALATADWQAVLAANGGASHIRLNHSLEHLYEPQALIADLARVARPGARLHIAVPNPRGLSAWLFGRYWRGLEAPRHICLFPAEQIERFLSMQGFTGICAHTEPTARDFARSWSAVGARASDTSKVDSAPESSLMVMLGLMLTLPAPLFGAGDRLHLFARRAQA